jgi:hypothetical protein
MSQFESLTYVKDRNIVRACIAKLLHCDLDSSLVSVMVVLAALVRG